MGQQNVSPLQLSTWSVFVTNSSLTLGRPADIPATIFGLTDRLSTLLFTAPTSALSIKSYQCSINPSIYAITDDKLPVVWQTDDWLMLKPIAAGDSVAYR